MRVVSFSRAKDPLITKSVLNFLRGDGPCSQRHAKLSTYAQGGCWTSTSAVGHGLDARAFRQFLSGPGTFLCSPVQSRGYASKGSGKASRWEPESHSRSDTYHASKGTSTRSRLSYSDQDDSYAYATRRPPCKQPIKPPDPVKGYPTPIITPSELDKYMIPLYKRGWSVESRRQKAKSGDRYYIPSLQLQFMGLDWERFLVLGKFVRQLEKSEKHHVEWRYSTGLELASLRTLGLDVPSPIALLLRTHSAILHPEARASLGPHEAFSLIPDTPQSITLRDIRFAILLDKLLTKHNIEYADDASQIRARNEVRTDAWRPKSLEGMLRGRPETTTYFKRKPVVKEVFYISDGWAKVLDEPEEGQVDM